MKVPPNNLSDRERIWLHLATEGALEAPSGGLTWSQGMKDRVPLWRYPQAHEPVAGQLVMAMTSSLRGPHPHAVGECVGRGDPGPNYAERDVPLIRAFGDPEAKAIWFFNESFYIWNDPDWKRLPVFLEGWQREYHRKVGRAARKAGDTWKYRWHSLRFTPEGAVITVRPHSWFDHLQPFEITLPAGPRTLQRELIAALTEGGFGTRWES